MRLHIEAYRFHVTDDLLRRFFESEIEAFFLTPCRLRRAKVAAILVLPVPAVPETRTELPL